jgi:outer membrane lipoprotein-sorting protein
MKSAARPLPIKIISTFALTAAWFALAISAFTVAVLFTPSGKPQKSPELDPIRRMEHRYRTAKTLQATFLERYTESGRTVRVESGVAYFRRPGKMRWEYAAPENNLFLIDGKTAWFYVPADRTVTRVPANQSTDWRTPLALLAGETKVSRVCAHIAVAAEEQPDKPDDVVFRCTLRAPLEQKNPNPDQAGASKSQQKNASAGALHPQATDQEDTVLLEISRQSGELARIVVRDKGGVGIEFQFARWLNDPPIAEALFHFQSPPGVAIVNGELPTGSGNSE